MEKVALAEKFALFSDYWSPKVIGEVDDYEIKLAKLKGDFVWHKHEHEDELFLVLKGVVNTGDVEGDRTVRELERI